jgi:histone chaperone ASF1
VKNRWGQIPEGDIIGMTVILIACSYREQEFVRVGYYVNNEYMEEFDPENPPRPVDMSKLNRSILADKPHVTRFPIDWGLGMEEGQQPQVTEEEAAAEGAAARAAKTTVVFDMVVAKRPW